MSIASWLGETSKSSFVEQYYHKLPFSCAGGGNADRKLGSWEVLGELLAAEPSPKHSQDVSDVMVVRQGKRSAEAPPKTLNELRELLDKQCTILMRHAEQRHLGLKNLADGFAKDFAAPVNIHVYVTPGETFGFGWHYDAEEVFILQTEGKKEYSLRKNTVHPWPLEETMPLDLAYPREIMPLMKCALSPGDWLYIPSGYWHKAVAEELSVSLAVGVMAPTAINIYDFLRRNLLASLLWRQRLPTVGEASPLDDNELRETYRQMLDQLAGDVARQLKDDDFLEEFLKELREQGSPSRD